MTNWIYSEVLWCCRDALSCKSSSPDLRERVCSARDLDKCRNIVTLRKKNLGDKNEHFQVTTWLSWSSVQRLCLHRRSLESESDLWPFAGCHLSLILFHSPAVQSNKANKSERGRDHSHWIRTHIAPVISVKILAYPDSRLQIVTSPRRYSRSSIRVLISSNLSGGWTTLADRRVHKNRFFAHSLK